MQTLSNLHHCVTYLNDTVDTVCKREVKMFKVLLHIIYMAKNKYKYKLFENVNVNPAKRKAMAVKNEKRFLKQKRNALKNPGYSHHPVKTQASFKRLLKAV